MTAQKNDLVVTCTPALRACTPPRQSYRCLCLFSIEHGNDKLSITIRSSRAKLKERKCVIATTNED
jgi:hypothetical protein